MLNKIIVMAWLLVGNIKISILFKGIKWEPNSLKRSEGGDKTIPDKRIPRDFQVLT